MKITTSASSREEILRFADDLEAAIGDIANGKMKANRLPLEPIARLIQFARDGAAEIDRLRRILDSRPAINSGLPETYIEWSQGIYAADFRSMLGHDA